ncbi:uncharacterized protein MYCFIDRAFT_175002 [Pseudocercospora fijiensis CIRAD86]|uniref:Uncharacterized protein n=1 Tax=Pseudocercospora fijiensis (strain CIRAD86) TaxID=383855 RepID=M3B2H6_PSEFD|nr:uncharacterized protein MYCFIDRAFT_175002 [Pseudocercospora fijiensis CIRAD86]EME83573.1 hypothetical protein MYCFIDRAFT_175002 [Pseudocercospora fijiensis CIRAD86]
MIYNASNDSFVSDPLSNAMTKFHDYGPFSKRLPHLCCNGRVASSYLDIAGHLPLYAAPMPNPLTTTAPHLLLSRLPIPLKPSISPPPNKNKLPSPPPPLQNPPTPKNSISHNYPSYIPPSYKPPSFLTCSPPPLFTSP